MLDIKLPSYAEGMTGDKSLSKAVNRALLLELINENESISRASLSKQSGLTKATVSSQVAELLELGIVQETGAGESELGRKPVMLEIRAEAGYSLGVSIISESMHVIVMDASGKVVKDEFVHFTSKEPDYVLEEIKKTIKSAKRRYAKSHFGLTGVGVAVPGAMEKTTGHLIRSAKLDWTDVSIVDELSSGFKGFIHAGNDATLATIAERELYATEEDDFICLLIDEGIGLGAYINGSIHYGHNGQFGEVGHMTIVHDGPLCPCGNHGCWDLFGSELALRQAIVKKMNIHDSNEVEVLELVREFSGQCDEVLNDFLKYLATGLVNVINSMAPSVIVINSSVLEASPEMFNKLQSLVTERSMAHLPACELRLSHLGKSAAAMGAGIAVQRKFFKSLILMES